MPWFHRAAVAASLPWCTMAVTPASGEQNGDDKFLFPFSTGKPLKEIKRLVAADPGLAYRASELGETPLHAAAISPETSPEVVEFLLASGASANQATVGEYRRTPLHWWLFADNPDKERIIELLISSGANPFHETEIEGEDGFAAAETLGLDDVAAKMLEWIEDYVDNRNSEDAGRGADKENAKLRKQIEKRKRLLVEREEEMAELEDDEAAAAISDDEL
ncbi:unnamed protein product [Amoebophrya sp. A25]|nr:unnamed protein product [Amoebophrya sp. A25]|eukprot:GSA25T00015199001.1